MSAAGMLTLTKAVEMLTLMGVNPNGRLTLPIGRKYLKDERSSASAAVGAVQHGSTESGPARAARFHRILESVNRAWDSFGVQHGSTDPVN